MPNTPRRKLQKLDVLSSVCGSVQCPNPLQDLSYKEKHWHEACFVCAKCRASLVDKQFGSKADRIYCGPCYDAQFATRCDGCGDVFRAGEFLQQLTGCRGGPPIS